jgi:hypothetical protein
MGGVSRGGEKRVGMVEVEGKRVVTGSNSLENRGEKKRAVRSLDSVQARMGSESETTETTGRIRKKKKYSTKGVRVVGVDGGERREQGRGRERLKGKERRRRSTHGRGEVEAGSQSLGVAGSYPRQTGVERGYMQVNREGERRVTKGRRRGVASEQKQDGYEGASGQERGMQRNKESSLRCAVSQKGAGEGEGRTERGGGVLGGWGTRRVANRYDYYREGHRVNRMSRAMCKISRGGK